MNIVKRNIFYNYIILAVFLIVLDVVAVIGSFYFFSNKLDRTIYSAYGAIANNLNAKLESNDANDVNVILFPRSDGLWYENSKQSKVYHDYLVSHNEATQFWLNTWLMFLGAIFAVLAFIIPMLLMKWHENKMKEIESDFASLKKSTNIDFQNLKSNTNIDFKALKDDIYRDFQNLGNMAKTNLEDGRKFKEESEGYLTEIKQYKKDIEKGNIRSKREQNFILVNSFINSEKYDKALFLLNQISKTDNLSDLDNALIDFSYATIYAKSGNIDNAIKCFQSAINKDCNNPAYYNDLGYYLSLKGNLTEAIQNYRKAIDIDDTQVLFWMNLSEAYRRQGDYARQEECIIQIKNLSPNNSMALNNLGTLYLSQGKLDKAVKYYDEAIRINAADAYLAYSNLGFIYNLQGRTTEAKFYIIKAIFLRPEIAINYLNLAGVYLKEGNLNDALKYIKIFNAKPERSDVYYSSAGFIYDQIRNILINLNQSNEYGISSELSIQLSKALKKYNLHAKR